MPSATPCSSAYARSAAKSSTRSHGMCSATDGASPVNRCTVAASAIFSSTVRGRARGAEHLEPGAGVAVGPRGDLDGLALQERGDLLERRHLTLSLVGSSGCGLGQLVLEVEDLLEDEEPLVRAPAVELLEELGHLGLPAGVDLGARPCPPGPPRAMASRSSRSAARRPGRTASSCASRSRASAASMSGQTCAWRSLYSAIRSGLTWSWKHTRTSGPLVSVVQRSTIRSRSRRCCRR